jgi:hypothetical protein
MTSDRRDAGEGGLGSQNNSGQVREQVRADQKMCADGLQTRPQGVRAATRGPAVRRCAAPCRAHRTKTPQNLYWHQCVTPTVACPCPIRRGGRAASPGNRAPICGAGRGCIAAGFFARRFACPLDADDAQGTDADSSSARRSQQGAWERPQGHANSRRCSIANRPIRADDKTELLRGHARDRARRERPRRLPRERRRGQARR